MLRRFYLLFAILTTLVIFTTYASRSSAADIAPDAAWSDKITPLLRTTLEQGGEAEFLVVLANQADVVAAPLPREKAARGRTVFQSLRAQSDVSQGPIRTLLDAAGAPWRSFWIVNAIWTRGDAGLGRALAAREEVATLVANPWVKMDEPAGSSPSLATPRAVEPGLIRIGADDAWAAGYTGDGIVLGAQDTGYQWDHPALINQYRGWDGTHADHNYHWHDAIRQENSPAPNPCGLDLEAPCDDNGHGTHTLGTMLGNNLDPADPDWPAGAANALGVAPGAQWIACRNMEQGYGTPASYIECFEWFVAPTDLNDENPDPALAPHAINNSWYCPLSEGCDPAATQLLESVVNNVRAAGIVVVTSAGNSGSGCGSVTGPPAIFESALSVGAVDGSDSIAAFSSRGPSSWTGLPAPEVVAPGVSVRSALPDNDYGYKSGTSMASPHVTGLIALLLEAHPQLIGQVDSIEAQIRLGAAPLTTSQSCGDLAGSEIPNNTYGWGRIEALTTLDVQLAPRIYLPITVQEP